MPREFRTETIKAILNLLDSEETMHAIAEVLSAECRNEKEQASIEASRRTPDLATIVKHEGRAAAFSEFVEVIRKAGGL
jgi:hypothetical protein